MDIFKLRVTVGDAQIELEGNGELVHTIFQELRDNGLGKLTLHYSQSTNNSNVALPTSVNENVLSEFQFLYNEGIQTPRKGNYKRIRWR